jgi:hypothetical protein
MANIVLGAINVVDDPGAKDLYEGEALFIRGIRHFGSWCVFLHYPGRYA